MANEFELTNKLNNIKEHYNIIVQDINNVNKINSELRKDNVSLLKEKEECIKIISETTNKLDVIKKLTEDKSIEYNNLQTKIKLLKDDFNNELNKFNEFIKSKEKIFDDKIKTSEMLYKQTIDNLSEQLSKIEKDIYNSNKTIINLENTIEIKSKEVDELNKIFSNKTKELNSIQSNIKDLNITIEEKTKELDILINKIIEEKSKIEKPLEFLAQKENIIAARERNLAILINRFNKVYSKIYPGQEVNI